MAEFQANGFLRLIATVKHCAYEFIYLHLYTFLDTTDSIKGCNL